MKRLGMIAAIGLTLHAAAFAARIGGSEGEVTGLIVEGFAELVSSSNGMEYSTCRGEQRQSWFEYDDGKQAVEWRTAVVPEVFESGRIVFTWSCGMTARQAFAVSHDLYLNNEKVITFTASVQDTVHQRDRSWRQGEYSLYYDYIRTNDWGDSFGVMHLGVPASAVSPGEAAALKVVGSPSDQGSFYMLTDYTDTAAWLRTQHNGGPVRGLREVTGEQIASLKAALQDADEGARLSAASDLIRLAVPEGTAALTELVLQASVEVRRAAAADLERARDPSTVPALVEVLGDDDVEVKLAALRALGNIGDPSTASSLTDVFHNSDGPVRASALTALAGMGEFRLPLAMQALEDGDPQIRLLTVHAMAGMSGGQSLAAMKAALKDEDVWVRNAAAYALGESGDDSAVPALVEALADSDEFVQRSAAAALCTITGESWKGTDRDQWLAWWEQRASEQ